MGKGWGMRDEEGGDGNGVFRNRAGGLKPRVSLMGG